MKERIKRFLFLSILLMPTIVSAKDNSSGFPLYAALLMEAFITIHMSLFVFKPLSAIIGKEDSKKAFWKMFFARIVFLIFFNLITTVTALIDFFAVFIGAFIVVPTLAAIKKVTLADAYSFKSAQNTTSYILGNKKGVC